jgi:hypothetical protein
MIRLFLRNAKGFVSGQNAQLFAVLHDYPNLRNTNPVVYAIEFTGPSAVASLGSFTNDAFSGWLFFLGVAIAGDENRRDRGLASWEGLAIKRR